MKSRLLFVDVGQGSSQVLLLGDRRAIVIDSGSSPDLPLRLLKLNQIDTLELVVISHGHQDHDGGFAPRASDDPSNAILSEYKTRIRKIAIVNQGSTINRPAYRYIAQMVRERALFPAQVDVISCGSEGLLLWQSAIHSIELRAISPFGGELLTEHNSNPNFTAAILRLRYCDKTVILSSDSQIQTWREIHRIQNNQPIECEIFTIPHHGGGMSETPEDLNWLSTNAVNASTAIVSVGTRNSHSHPRRAVIAAFARSNCHIMCTEMTNQCCASLEVVRPSLCGRLLIPCRSRPNTCRKGNPPESDRVACAGTIEAILADGKITIHAVESHRLGVQRLQSQGHTPMCISHMSPD